MIIYGVHRFGWGNVGEIELLTAQLVNAEDFAKARSGEWTYGQVIVTGRKLDNPGALRLISVWRDGERVRHFGPNGEWRRVRASPF